MPSPFGPWIGRPSEGEEIWLSVPTDHRFQRCSSVRVQPPHHGNPHGCAPEHSDLGRISEISPDGSIVAVTRGDGVELWRTDTLEPIRSLQGSASVVDAIEFDGPGDRIAIVDLQGTVGVWDVTTGKPVYAPPAEVSDVGAVSFAEDGSRIVVLYDDGRIISYPIALDDAIEFARSDVTRSFTEAECRTYLHVASCPTG